MIRWDTMSKIRTPKQQRGIETKQQIVKAAHKLFASKGIHGTSSREIAKKAGVSIGSFYSYFKNKKTLLLEMLDDYIEQHYQMAWYHLDSFENHQMDQEKLRKIIESVFEAYNISPDFHRQTHALRYSDPDIKKIYDKDRERELHQIQYLIEKNTNRQEVINDFRAAAMVIHNAVENVAHTAKFLGTDIKENLLIDGLVTMISSFLIKEQTP